MRELFKYYLEKIAKKSDGKNYKSVNSYTSSIITASNSLGTKFYLLNDNEIEILESVNKKLEILGEKKEIGDLNSKGVRASMKLYEKFRKHLKDYPDSYKSKINIKTKNEELIEDTIELNFSSLSFFKNYKIIKRQFKSGGFKYDLLLEHKIDSKFLIVEIKDAPISSASIAQIVNYVNDFKEKKENYGKSVTGLIIGHFLTESANQFYNENIKNCEIQFLKFNLNIELAEIEAE